MRWTLFAILSLIMGSVGSAQPAPPAPAADPPCVLDVAEMPESWRPPDKLQTVLNPSPWSKSEAEYAERAVGTALDEMIGFFKRHPSAVQNLWDDSIESLIQITHASANAPERDAKARKAARENLTALLAPYVDRDPDWAVCDEFDHLLPLAIFAHRLNPPGDTLTGVVVKRTNAAFRDCGSLEAAMDIDAQSILASKGARAADTEDLFDLYLWSLWLTEAGLYPDIKLSAEAGKLGPAAWSYFQSYRLTGAHEHEDGAKDERFAKIAGLAVRIAHIPTGAHRFPLYVKDKPGLYRFLREHFYAVLQLSRPGLTGSFVDALRQYGCSAETDRQVRDGSRYLLKVFHDGNDSWMDGMDDDMSDYDRIHRPWKAALGLRDRQPAQPKPGTYGGIVRGWLAGAQQEN